MDICRVRAGTRIESSWKLVVPHGKNQILSGSIDVYFNDVVRNYGITGSVVEIPWKDFFAADTWDASMNGLATALALIRWKTPEGIEEVWKAQGEARLLVLAKGYDPLPMDSGFVAWQTKCKIQYSTAGRGALECK
jgi:hypothetical protein